MAKHRSLSNALLTPEKMAFIKAHDSMTPEEAAVPSPAEKYSSDRTSADPRRLTPTKEVISPARETQTSEVSADDDLYRVAITTRLKTRTADALRRAYLDLNQANLERDFLGAHEKLENLQRFAAFYG